VILIYKKASAWYVACYEAHDVNKHLRILSFPWIVEDVIQLFPNIKSTPDTFATSIIEQYLSLNNREKVFETYTEVVKLKENVSKRTSLRLTLVDMVGLFLFDFSANEFHFQADNNNNDTIHDREMMSAFVKDLLEHEFDLVSIEENNNNDTDIIKCQLNEGFSLRISLSSSSPLSYSKQRFLFLRQVIFENDFMLPLFGTILHFVRQDVKFIDATTFDREWYLEFFASYCIQNGFIREPSQSATYDFGGGDDDGLNDLCHIYDTLSYIALGKEPGLTGRILLEFYREYAFKLENDLRQIRREHFLNVFNLISNVTEIGHVWDTVIGDHRDEAILYNDDDELLNTSINTSRHSLNYIEKSCRSPCLYAKDAFVLLFANSNSKSTLFADANMIQFELYAGKKFFKHTKKECYVPKLVVNDDCGFLKQR
jgi:hypothetical protein